MVAVLRKQGVAYFGIPKSAGTSVYLALYRAAFGTDYPRASMDIHYVFPGDPITDGIKRDCADLWKFTIIRDPIQRVISAFHNRVHDMGDLERSFGHSLRSKLGAARRRLKVKPSLNAFFLNYNTYVKHSHPLWHHTRPISAFIGDDLSYFDAVYRIDESDRLAADLSDRLNEEFRLPRANRSHGNSTFETLPKDVQNAIWTITKPDYELLSDYFQPPKGYA